MPTPHYDTVDCVITRVIYHKVSDWSDTGVPYLIAATTAGIVKGEMYRPVVGERYRLFGEWRSKGDESFFGFQAHEVLIKRTEDGIHEYITRYIPGFGDARAREFINKYKLDSLDVLRANPHLAAEVRGITEAIVEEIKEFFDSETLFNPADWVAVYDILHRYNPPQKVMLAILTDFGSSAASVIRENPYMLLSYQGLGWQTVDKVACNEVKYNKLGIHRYKAGVLESLKRRASEGDTVVDRKILSCYIYELCGAGGPYDEAVESLKNENKIISTDINGKEFISLFDVGAAERTVAERLLFFGGGDPVKFDTNGLEGEQIAAVESVSQNSVCLLTGPAGSGKTFTTTRVISSFRKAGLKVVVNTPTGKAAKRVSEVLDAWLPGSGVTATTIHRALGSVANQSAPAGASEKNAKFMRGRKKTDFDMCEQKYLDADVAIIDECSMVDVELLAAWLKALPPHCRVLMVGDPNQLPSVGPGSTLRDMMAAGVPCASLTQPRRNSGDIVKACHAIKDGKTPKPSGYDLDSIDLGAGKNWVHLDEKNLDNIASMIVQLHKYTDRDPLWDLQVITPQNAKLPVACGNLNRLLSAFFNPTNHEAKDEDNQKYSILDKVVRTKNGQVPLMEEGDPDDLFSLGDGSIHWRERDYTISHTYVVNGDIGQVLDFVPYKRKNCVVVRFRSPDRLCLLPRSEAEISLAYAISIHKSQGSGWPVVIAPVSSQFFFDSRTGTGLWTRELLYTMFSRAEQILITVGEESSIGKAISRKTLQKRKTALQHFINTGK